MIAIQKPKRVEKGVRCGVCRGGDTVKVLTFRADDALGGTSIFVCAHCRDELTSELELTKFYEGCK